MKPTHFLGAFLLLASETAPARAADCASVALGAIPSCAQSCFLEGAPSVGCDGTDFACQCEHEAKLYAAIEGCVSSGCPSASYQAVIDGASSVCDCATAGQPGGGGGSMTVSGSYVGSVPATTTASGIGGGGGGSDATTSPQPGTGSTTFANTLPTTAPVPGATVSVVSGGIRLGRPGFSIAAGSAMAALIAFVSF